MIYYSGNTEKINIKSVWNQHIGQWVGQNSSVIRKRWIIYVLLGATILQAFLYNFAIFDIKLNKYKTRMTTFIKTKLKKSDNQTNIDKYRIAVYIEEY